MSKMLANTAYELIGTLAHNLMRFPALIEDPFHPTFAKLLRFRMVKLACEVVTHANGDVPIYETSHIK